MSNVSSKRIYFLDYARAFAVLLVVLCHVAERAFDVGQSHWFIYTFIHNFGRLGVPLFLMISGALQLRKSVTPGEFYKKSLLPLLLVSEIWIIVNYVVSLLYTGGGFSIQELLGQVFFLDSLKLPHMWFIPEIIILYLVVPFIALVVKQFSLRNMLIPLGIMYATCFVMPTVFHELSITNENPLLQAPILGGMTGFYLIVGYYLSHSKIVHKIKTSAIALALATFVLLNFAIQCLIHYKQQSIYPLDWYTNPFLIIIAGLILVLMKKILDRETRIYPIMRYVSSAAFGIFFLHYFIIRILGNYISWFGRPIWFLVALISSFVVSFGAVIIVSKINRRLAFRLFLYKT
ncbi:acyltransferase [Candidatus Saccharibacteria bacterium]|nr:acyltransferase [Candidatus Saccharibacteria bacterium]